MTHDELRELTGGYALGVLSEAERRAIETHLPTCVECAREVREFVTWRAGWPSPFRRLIHRTHCALAC